MTPVRSMLVVVLLTAACVPPLTYPYSAQQLGYDSRTRPAQALAHYFGQADADPQVCDVSRRQPILAFVDADMIDALVDAMLERKLQVRPAWQCIQIALAQQERIQRRRSIALIADAYLDVLEDAHSSPRLRAALQNLLVRSEAARGEADALKPLQKQLAKAIAGKDLDETATLLAQQLIDALELGQNRFHGRAVTPEAISELDETTLQLAAERLSGDLRQLAAAELLRRRARRSVYPLVRDDVEAVVARVLSTGHNALDLTAHPIAAIAFSGPSPVEHVIARQNVARHQAQLLAVGSGSGNPQERIPLKGWLWMGTEGVSPSISLCGPAGALDPTPCLLPEQLSLTADAAQIDAEGVIELPDNLPVQALLTLLDDAPSLSLTARLGARQAQHDLPLRLIEADPMIFHGDGPSERGPDLIVELHPHHHFVVVEVTSKADRWIAIVDPAAPGRVAIVSRGEDGEPGIDGSNGMSGSSGSDGSNASCSFSAGDGSDGHDGSNGGDGGPGGPGGDAGDIRVLVSCGAADCEALLSLARRLVDSAPGAGGRGGLGGSGGSGGRGGRGGSGTTCTQNGTTRSVSGGRDGRSGSSGRSGFAGANGPPGQPGEVSIERTQ
jgi:hypothetical protein